MKPIKKKTNLKQQPKSVSPSDSKEPKEDTGITREAFFAALEKVSRPIQPQSDQGNSET